MSTKPLMLEGIGRMKPDADDGFAGEWRRDKQQLEEELRGVRRELEDVQLEKDKAQRALKNLRANLDGLYKALRFVFGEIDLAVGQETSNPAVVSSPNQPTGGDPRWESYKNTFPGVPAGIVDALLAHRAMTLTQLAALLRRDYSTIKVAAQKLSKAGAIVREGKGGPLRLNV